MLIDQHTRYTHVIGTDVKVHTAKVLEQYKKTDNVGKFYKNILEKLNTDGGGEYRK